MSPDFSPERSQRIDLWLWTARIFKTRSAATTACRGGHVHVGGQRVKAAQKVRIGDTVRVRRAGFEQILVIRGFTDRRGPATLAQQLYEDRTPAPDPALRGFTPRRDKGLGRPTKKDRRELDRLRGYRSSGQ